MQEPKGLDIRFSISADEPYLKEWLMNEECCRWFPMSTPEEIDAAAHNWIGFSKYKASLTAVIEGKPCGIGTLFLMPYQKVCHQAMFYVIVDPKLWRKGIGTSLLKNLVDHAQNFFRLESLHCEVFEECPIISLLERLSFKKFIYQDKFVKEKNGRYLARLLYECFF